MTRAFVGLGSNLGDPPGIVREALARLETLGTRFVNSDLYLTEPWGVGEQQPRYINAVAAFDYEGSAADLHAALRAIEKEFGRDRAGRNAPRTLDLDLLLFGDSQIRAPELAIPHPRMHGRAFVLEPLAEIAPQTRIPGSGRTAAELCAALAPSERASMTRLFGTATLAAPRRVDYDAPGGAGTGYESLRPFANFDRTVLAQVLDALGPVRGKSLLDVGCGTGRFSRALADEGAAVTGLDISETMLAAARAHASPPVRYVKCDANESLPHGPFDAITAFYCAQYLDMPALLRRAFAHAAPNARLSVATFPHLHFAENAYAAFFPSLPALDMARFPSVPALQTAFRAAGFSHVETRESTIEVTDDPASLIERVEKKYLSSFFLVPEDEFRRGVAAMREAWIGKQTISRMARSVVLSGRRAG